MRLYLAETLVPRHARHALGVETAVDWSTCWGPGMENRQILSGSGGTRLIRGKFTPIVHEVRCVCMGKCLTELTRVHYFQGDEIRGDRTWSRPFNLKYRFAAGEPVFKAALYIRDFDCISLHDGEDWLRDENGAKSLGSVSDLELTVPSRP